MTTKRELHVERGGASGRGTLLLLHGLGANASVWQPLLAEITRQWPGRWLAPDLRGHGRSFSAGPYGFGTHAADVAALVADPADGPVHVLGHSFGGVVGALLASGLFGPQVARLFAFGVKLAWTAGEISKGHELSRRARRVFADREEAVSSYLKGAGLVGLVDPRSAEATSSVVEVAGGHQVRLDPGVFACVGPAIPPLFALVKCPWRLAAGETDPMVTLAETRQVDAAALAIAGAGHNAHLERPDAVWKAASSFLFAS